MKFGSFENQFLNLEIWNWLFIKLWMKKKQKKRLKD